MHRYETSHLKSEFGMAHSKYALWSFKQYRKSAVVFNVYSSLQVFTLYKLLYLYQVGIRLTCASDKKKK